MKIAILPDTHFGIRNDYKPILEKQRRFFEEVFFPTLNQRNIKTIVSLGDLVDRRKYINFHTGHYLKKYFLDVIHGEELEFYIIPGNHDIYFRNSLEVNALNILLRDNANIVDIPSEIEFDGTNILMVPWICAENKEECFKMMNKTKATVCFGHFEIDGFEMNSGVTSVGGLDPNVFDKFDTVLSGHYHQRSQKGNIHYVGAVCEMISSDMGEYRGFCIFDTTTREIEYFRNPITLFSKVFYDDRRGYPTIPNGGFESLKDMIVKVIISGKNNPTEYDNFITNIEKNNPIDITIVDDHLNINRATTDEIIGENADTSALIKDFCNQAEGQVNKDKLTQLLVSLYSEASNH